MAGLEGIDASRMEIVDALGAVRWEYDEADRVARPLVRHADRVPVAINSLRSETAGPSSGPGFERVVAKVRFGMPLGPRLLTNARDDSLERSSAWRSLFGRPGHHCLTAISYVLERDQRTKQSYRIQRRDGRLIVVPGLCAVRHFKFASTGNEYDDLCHVQVTTEPNEFVRQVHGRFVVDLVDAGDRDVWMSADRASCRDVLRPAPEDAYELVPVAADVWTRRGSEGSADPTGPPVRSRQSTL